MRGSYPLGLERQWQKCGGDSVRPPRPGGPLDKMQGVALLGWTLGFLRPYRWRAAAIVALALAEVGLATLAPWPLKVLVDSVLGETPLPSGLTALLPGTMISSASALLVAVVVAGVVIQLGGEMVRVIHTQLQVGVGQRVIYALREQLLGHLQRLPLGHHITHRTADAVYRLDADAYCVDDLIIGGVFPLLLAGLNLAVMFAVLVYVDLTLALLALIVLPFLYLSLRRNTGPISERAESVKLGESTLIERAFEVLSSIAAVKSFGRERHELERFSAAGAKTMRARLGLTWQESRFSLSVTAITLLGTALVLLVGGLHVLNGQLTVGSLLVVIAYLSAVYAPVSEIARTTGSLQQAVVSARRVQELLALPPEENQPDAVVADQLEGRIRFDSVNFSYDGQRPVLEDVSFAAQPGELVALVGLTGAGKTTLANLIPRLLEPTSGQVLLDGRPVSAYRLDSLRDRIALVPQTPVLFTGSIADNIRYGRLDASDTDVQTAASAAHAHDFIARFPEKYATNVAEAGASLSGGERQRIGIARALLKNAPILILDEPTSSLDALSEAEVFDALRLLRRGRTTLVIAHRLSTIQDADRILVLHHGRILAQGTHEALLASTPLYRAMCARLSLGRSLDVSSTSTVDELLQDISPR